MSKSHTIGITYSDIVMIYAALTTLKSGDKQYFRDLIFELQMHESEFYNLVDKIEQCLDKVNKNNCEIKIDDNMMVN